MLLTLSRKSFLRLSIVISLLCYETSFSFLRNPEASITVAFLGVRYENVDPVLQTRIRIGILGVLYQNENITVISPEQVARMIGEGRTDRILAMLSADSLRSVSNALGVDYVFAGQLQRVAGDTTHTILEGAFYRFDRADEMLKSTKVLRYADDFDQELENLRHDMVETIVPKNVSFFSKYWPVLLVGSLVAGGILLVISSSASQSSPGGQTTPPTTTH